MPKSEPQAGLLAPRPRAGASNRSGSIRADRASDPSRRAARLIELLADREEGEVHPRTLETPSSFEVARLVERRAGGAIEVELASFDKPTLHDWFWEAARRVPVSIHDATLRAALFREIAWARELDAAGADGSR